MFYGLLALALVPTIAALAIKTGRGILAFLGAGGWILFGVHCYTLSTATWDIYYSVFWLSMGMVFVSSLMPALLREKAEDESLENTNEYADDDVRDNPELFPKVRETPKQHRVRKHSRFSRTGEE